ncbi:ABC transporter ATP-binding protein/permease [bacterium]|nr:ABC transporter ATP-binding protein/permease [bacterium]
MSQLKDVKLLQKFSHYVKPHKGWFFLGVSAIPFTTAATVIIPLLIVRIIDDYIVPGDLEGLYQMILPLAAAILVGYLADGLYNYSLQRVGHLAIARMRTALFSHTLSLPRRYFDKTPIGLTLSRITSDMEALGESITIGVLSLFTDILKTISLFIFLFYLSWKLTLIIILVIPVVYLVASYLRKKLRFYYNTARTALADASAFLQECLNGIKTVQLYNAEKKVLRQFKEKNGRFLKSQTRSNTYDAALFSVVEGLTSVTMAIIIWYGAGQVLAGIVTIGILIGFINTLSKIFIPIREFAQQLAMIQRALSALEHIYQLFSEKSEESEEAVPEALREKLAEFECLEFKDVSYRYSKKSPPVLQDISFRLQRGQKIALVGTTGAGKTTILKVLTKTYQNYDGSIRLNGIELSLIPRAALIKIITMMQQDVFLFNESLSFNISLNREGISAKDIKQATQYVYADRFIEQLPEKIDSQITDHGSNLSAGQGQLISFARAVVSDSELVLLDEATSSVDSITESYIQKAIENIFSSKTVIAIAHRLSTIQNSDQILVMKDGRIIERGNHHALVAANGHYVQLLNQIQGSH